MPIGDTWKRRRWNAIRYDPWQNKKIQKKSKVNQIKQQKLLLSKAVARAQFLHLGLRMVLSFGCCLIFTCVFLPILLILFAVASTFIFSFIGLRVLCVGISLSLYLAYFVNFLFPLLPRHSYTLYIDGIVPICQCNLCSLPFKISWNKIFPSEWFLLWKFSDIETMAH